MSKLETAFKTLMIDDDALQRLANSIEPIRTILSQNKLTAEQSQRLGHNGLSAEWIHGMYYAQYQIKKYLKKNDEDEYPIANCINKLFEITAKPSQLSQHDPNGPHINETALEAIPRSITDIQIWMKENPGLSNENRLILIEHIKEFEANFAPINDFIKNYAPS